MSTATCWELTKRIERELKGFGTDDNTPLPEMALPEQDILLSLLESIKQTKDHLNLLAYLRDENDGRIPVEAQR